MHVWYRLLRVRFSLLGWLDDRATELASTAGCFARCAAMPQWAPHREGERGAGVIAEVLRHTRLNLLWGQCLGNRSHCIFHPTVGRSSFFECLNARKKATGRFLR